jgi:hypothetical protein
VHDDKEITNNMDSRTTGAINLGPTGNVKGTHKFLSLKTGEILVQRNWTELPVPNDVIARIKDLAEMAKSNMDGNNPIVKDCVDDLENASVESETSVERDGNNDILEEISVDHESGPSERDINTVVDQDNKLINENEEVLPMSYEEEQDGSFERELDIRKEEVSHDYNLRPSRTRGYSYKFSFLSVNAGLKKWGDNAKKALIDELKFLIKEEVFVGVINPTEEQKNSALRMHCFIVKKRDGSKARAVADGILQERYMEEETYSLTVRLESIMLSSLIDAYERRCIRTVDIKGAFLKAKVPEDLELIVKMDRQLAELMNEVRSDFKIDEEGVMYLQCVKALYGHREAARLFYDDLNRTLAKKMNFVRNRYNPCVYNKRTDSGIYCLNSCG